MILKPTKTSFILVIYLILLTACDKTDQSSGPSCENCSFTCIENESSDVITNTCKENWDCSFKVISDSEVAVNEYQGVSSGSKLVFQMINSTEGAAEIADDEFTNILVLELEKDQSSFSVENDVLKNLNIQYVTICFCPFTEFISPVSGCIQGQLQEDDNWFVQGNLAFEGPNGNFEVLFDAEFTPM